MNDVPAYSELHCLSDFSFLRGASPAKALFERAAANGYTALAITDECSLAGIVRAHEAAKRTGIRLIIGVEVTLQCATTLVLLAEDLGGYQRICHLVTVGRRAADKGGYRLVRDDVERIVGRQGGVAALWLPHVASDDSGAWVAEQFPGSAWIAVELLRERDDARWLAQLEATGKQHGLPLVAAGGVQMAVRGRKPIHDVLAAIREHVTLAEAGTALAPNGERHLRSRHALGNIYPPALLAATKTVADRCRFQLDQLTYTYPRELVPQGQTMSQRLAELTFAGMAWRWPNGPTPAVRKQIEGELDLIAELGYEPYFLTVHDIVAYARSQKILCQGRGSAANSAVCYALGITEVSPDKMDMLMARFISRERSEPPDIDIDFEHERREEVFQYIYRRFGRDRAAIASMVIRYRARSASRDVARAMGLPEQQAAALSAALAWWDGQADPFERIRDAGFDPESPVLQRILMLVAGLLDHPRHLSQHVGGFVITDDPLWTLVPVENAAMPDRTIIQWDKDDLDALQLLKIDCLALGMLTCLRKTFDLLASTGTPRLGVADIPGDDPATYAMIGKADTVGVFQIESRAQMATLPRMKPACFYDLVIEVALIRPGPISGGLVHPYLQRRQGKEIPTYPNEVIERIFGKTLGVPLFQEQIMRVAIEAAGYTPGEADGLRRSMAAWQRHGNIEEHRQRVISGMVTRGYSEDYAHQTFEHIMGFSAYGFPESHSVGQAILAYASAWLKCHHPAAFASALLNSQPMGFYSSSQIIQDVRRHGVIVLPVDVNSSEWDSTLVVHPRSAGGLAIRLGMREIGGLAGAAAERIVAERRRRPFANLEELCHRAGLDRRARALLAESNALEGLVGHRNQARWKAAGIEAALPLFPHSTPEAEAAMPAPSVVDAMFADYRATGLTLGPHPMSLLRGGLDDARCLDAESLKLLPPGAFARVAGLITLRQRPGTAKGTTFLTLEDETGNAQIIVWPRVAAQFARVLAKSQMLVVEGKWDAVDGVGSVIAQRLRSADDVLHNAQLVRSRDYR